MTKIREREHSLELLYRLCNAPERSPVSAPELMLELQWSPEWLDEQVAELRRRAIRVRAGANETLCVTAPCWKRAKALAEEYALAMGYSLRTSLRRVDADAARLGAHRNP